MQMFLFENSAKMAIFYRFSLSFQMIFHYSQHPIVVSVSAAKNIQDKSTFPIISQKEQSGSLAVVDILHKSVYVIIKKVDAKNINLSFLLTFFHEKTSDICGKAQCFFTFSVLVFPDNSCR